MLLCFFITSVRVRNSLRNSKTLKLSNSKTLKNPKVNELTHEQQHIKNELETAQQAVVAAELQLALAAATLDRLSENAPEATPYLSMEYLDKAIELVNSVECEVVCNLLEKNLRN